MNDFFESVDNDREYKFRILVWPNITYQENLSKDSYVVVLRKIITALNCIRNDIHWTIVSPQKTTELVFDNTEQRIYSFPNNPNLMRCHFDVNKLENLLDLRHNAFDVVYSHLPEHTSQLSNVIYNYSGWRPKIIGYCHWFELPENAQYKKTMFRANLNGILEMEQCGVNSAWIKNRVLEEAKKIFSQENVDNLERIIQPHYLGTESDFSVTADRQIPKSILFNHRLNKYTGWKPFLTVMDKLWKKRQDFKVFITFSDECKDNRPYLNKVDLSKKEYLQFIKRIHVGVGTFVGYSAWSLSAMDGLGRGLPYLLPNSLCYPEMVGNNYPLLYNNEEEFLVKIEKILDEPNFKEKMEPILKNISGKYDWNTMIATWFNGWDILNEFPKTEKSSTYPEILDLIKKKKEISNNALINHFGWGRAVDYAFYRNMLRDESSIKMTISGYKLRQ